MQFYLQGINPIFWKMIKVLPDGIYNKENNQTSSAQIEQLLVAFVDKPAGSLVTIVFNSKQTGTFSVQAIVVDDTGLVYTRVDLPYTQNSDDFEVAIFDSDNAILERSFFATSHIVFVYEIQAKILHGIMEDTQQLSENITIQGVEDGLLENKFGKFTGLSIRPEQTIGEYRSQTACLWKSYQHASMTKGVIDSIKCILDDVTVVLLRTRDDFIGTIFDRASFIDDDDVFGTPIPDDYVDSDWTDPISIIRDDLDEPHFYIAAIEDSYDLNDNPQDIILNTGTDNTPGAIWGSDVAQSLVIVTEEAISNEIQLVIGSNEEDASSLIPTETVLRRPDNVTLGALPDQLNNINVLPFVTVTQATIGGNPAPAALPVENIDFTVDRFTGQITWTPQIPDLTPDAGTLYSVTYRYRLDEALKIVIKKIKPAFRSVILQFVNVMSGLPTGIEV